MSQLANILWRAIGSRPKQEGVNVVQPELATGGPPPGASLHSTGIVSCTIQRVRPDAGRKSITGARAWTDVEECMGQSVDTCSQRYLLRRGLECSPFPEILQVSALSLSVCHTQV